MGIYIVKRANAHFSAAVKFYSFAEQRSLLNEEAAFQILIDDKECVFYSRHFDEISFFLCLVVMVLAGEFGKDQSLGEAATYIF